MKLKIETGCFFFESAFFRNAYQLKSVCKYFLYHKNIGTDAHRRRSELVKKLNAKLFRLFQISELSDTEIVANQLLGLLGFTRVQPISREIYVRYRDTLRLLY